MKKFNNSLFHLKQKSLLISMLIIGAPFLSDSLNKIYAGAGQSTLLGTNAATVPRPFIAPQPNPITIPAPPAIPNTLPPVPIAPNPNVAHRITNPDKGGIDCAPRIHHNTRKSAEQAAKWDSRRGGGGGPDGKNGKSKLDKGKYGHHYHGLDKKGNHLPTHHYFPKSVTVAPGDSLYKIANKYGLNYKDLQSINGIKDPTKIRPGQVIKLG